MMLLAATDSPDFLRVAPVDVADFLIETLHRWSQTRRRWSLGPLAEASVPADEDRLTLALDALIENAVDHTGPDGRIELSARRDGERVILAVTDSGPASRRPRWGGSSAGSPASTRAAAGRPAGSDSGWPLSRRSPRPTTVPCRCAAPSATAPSSS